MEDYTYGSLYFDQVSSKKEFTEHLVLCMIFVTVFLINVREYFKK